MSWDKIKSGLGQIGEAISDSAAEAVKTIESTAENIIAKKPVEPTNKLGCVQDVMLVLLEDGGYAIHKKVDGVWMETKTIRESELM